MNWNQFHTLSLLTNLPIEKPIFGLVAPSPDKYCCSMLKKTFSPSLQCLDENIQNIGANALQQIDVHEKFSKFSVISCQHYYHELLNHQLYSWDNFFSFQIN